jgi:hypothetical protein
VRLAGIEPTTPWFVAKYSIQLSYSREALNYNIKKPIFSAGVICLTDSNSISHHHNFNSEVVVPDDQIALID